MTSTIRLPVVVAAVGLLGICAARAGHAQESGFAVDPKLAKRGQSVWQNGGCGGCHAIGKKMAGPDLAGVYERRSREWLARWLKNTDEMLATDSAAQAMLAEYNNIRMPNLNLTDADADAVLHYIAQETEKQRTRRGS
jgi:protein SCO1/2